MLVIFTVGQFYYLLRLKTNKDEQVILTGIKHHTKNIQKKTFKQWNIPFIVRGSGANPIKDIKYFLKDKLNSI